MATKSTPGRKVNQLAKDLDVKTKDLLSTLDEVGISGKNTSAALEGEEFNLLFEHLTKNNQIRDIDGYMNGKTSITLPESEEKKAAREKAEAEAAAKAKAEAEAKAKAEAEAKAKAEAEAKAKAEAEAKAKAEAEAKAKAEEAERNAPVDPVTDGVISDSDFDDIMKILKRSRRS